MQEGPRSGHFQVGDIGTLFLTADSPCLMQQTFHFHKAPSKGQSCADTASYATGPLRAAF